MTEIDRVIEEAVKEERERILNLVRECEDDEQREEFDSSYGYKEIKAILFIQENTELWQALKDH